MHARIRCEIEQTRNLHHQRERCSKRVDQRGGLPLPVYTEIDRNHHRSQETGQVVQIATLSADALKISPIDQCVFVDLDKIQKESDQCEWQCFFAVFDRLVVFLTCSRCKNNATANCETLKFDLTLTVCPQTCCTSIAVNRSHNRITRSFHDAPASLCTLRPHNKVRSECSTRSKRT